MRAIPLSVRERIVQLYDRGKSTREIADVFGFCVAAVRRVRQHYKARGTLEPQTHRCGRNTLLTEAPSRAPQTPSGIVPKARSRCRMMASIDSR